MLVWFVGTLTALASAPGGLAAEAPEPVTVVGGDAVSPDEADEYSAVVAIVINSTICSGTLVADDLILTAAHCLRNVSSVDDIRVFNGLTLGSPGVHATDFGSHPDFDVEAKRDAYDYGFVSIIAGSLDATPIPVVTVQAEWDEIEPTLEDADAITLAGYGLDPDAPSNVNLGVKRRVTTNVRGFTESGIEFVAGGDGRDSCEGDSGGPALARNAAGELRLIGITARGSDPCGKGGFYGVPYYALAWLSEAVARPLCGDECGTCDCLDTAPAADSGCGCTSSDDTPSALWLFALVLGLRARRRSTR